MIHVLVLSTEEGRICLNVDNEEDAGRLLREGARELSKTEIQSLGMDGYEHLVCPANTVVHGDGSIAFTPPVITPEEVMEQYAAAIQRALDAFAQTRGYDGIVSACSYATSSNARYAAEADYCVRLRDDTWAKCYELFDGIRAGGKEFPRAEAFLALLPVSDARWPA